MQGGLRATLTVARSVLKERSSRETLRLFVVSFANAVKLSQRLRSTGSAFAKPRGRYRCRILLAEQARMLGWLRKKPQSQPVG